MRLIKVFIKRESTVLKLQLGKSNLKRLCNDLKTFNSSCRNFHSFIHCYMASVDKDRKLGHKVVVSRYGPSL